MVRQVGKMQQSLALTACFLAILSLLIGLGVSNWQILMFHFLTFSHVRLYLTSFKISRLCLDCILQCFCILQVMFLLSSSNLVVPKIQIVMYSTFIVSSAVRAHFACRLPSLRSL